MCVLCASLGASDLKDGNKKLALGLVWMLILNYQIVAHTRTSGSTSSSNNAGSSSSSSGGSGSSGGSFIGGSGSGGNAEKRRSGEINESSAKKILLEWYIFILKMGLIHLVYKIINRCSERAGEPVANFETSFCDGKVFAKIMNSIEKK